MQNQVSVSVYIVKAIHHIIICSQTEYSILLTAWQEINMKMWIHISQSIIIISKQEFIKIMKDQCFNWKFMFMNIQSNHKHDFKLEKISVKFFYNSHFYYQLLIHIFYLQSYLILTYFSQNEWSSQEYNNYWENKKQ